VSLEIELISPSTQFREVAPEKILSVADRESDRSSKIEDWEMDKITIVHPFGFAQERLQPFSGRLTAWLRSAERSAAKVISMTCRACSGVTNTGRSSATASIKWTVSASIGP